MARGDNLTCPHCGGDLNRWPGDAVLVDGELNVASLTIGQTCQKYPASGYTIDGVYTGFEKETEVISEYPSRQEH